MGKSTKKLTSEVVLLKIKNQLLADDYDFNKFEYINIRTPITLTCKKHGNFNVMPRDAIKGKACKICDKLKLKYKKNSLNLEEYKIFASELHNFKYDYSSVTELTDKITIICKLHGPFTTRASAHISPSQHYGCKRCNQTLNRGETVIQNFLSRHKINFVSEWCMEGQTAINNKQSLPYDFYIPDKNLIIEYDGPHHFEPTRYGGQTFEKAVKQHKLTKFYDGIKTANAMEMRISILRINYKLFEILDQVLYINVIENLPIYQLRILRWNDLDTDQQKHTVIMLDYRPHSDSGKQTVTVDMDTGTH